MITNKNFTYHLLGTAASSSILAQWCYIKLLSVVTTQYEWMDEEKSDAFHALNIENVLIKILYFFTGHILNL